MGSINERRAAMASNHNALVKALIDGIGEDKAVEIGRAALFKVGQDLGEEARIRFSVGDSLEDLILAARVMYKVLGIDFDVHGGGKELTIEIDRCALSETYSEITCMVTSAADEGVVRGLNPSVRMRFETRITSGYPTCVARIKIDHEEPE
ncbi:MAG: L-2-amino-thiazoline-4-carboxylic acid hydrolase [Candidatus Bathyarchaeota archaeon]|nr:L-2-amino-thiazoline-4-carboxylic acid hydrolase [Candidatus Bathyarchaeota archaeon]